ncbi:MAG TPA: efflux RND transporter periplasmic adaptor subunit [Sphingomonas sp.]
MPRLTKTGPIAFLGLLLATVSLTGCAKAPADPRVGPQLVRVATAGNGGEAEREFTGIVSARVQSDLGFRVPGKIVERLVDTGQAVRRGQPLMRIDRTDLALATMAQAGSVAAARAHALQTAADERRYRDLVSAGAVSASAYDQMKAAADAAKAQFDAAEAQAGVARNQAGYSVLLADADGIVVETLAEPGQVVAAGQTVVRLAHAGPREATVSLPETIRPAIGSIASAAIFNADAPGGARLRQLSNAADPQTRTYEARYVLQGAAANAPLGATVTIRLADAKAAAAMAVPLAALYDNGHGPGVWIVGGTPLAVAWRPVRLAGLGDETATITGGLRPGERFVALGAHLLHPGEQVRVAPDPAAAR